MAKDVFFNNVPQKNSAPEPEDMQFEDISNFEPRRPERGAVDTRPARRPYDTGAAARAAVNTGAQRKSVPDAAKPVKKRKKHGFIKFLLTLIIIVLFFTAAGGIAAIGAFNYVLKDYRSYDFGSNRYVSGSELMRDASVMNILLLGVDFAEAGESTRSDAMILMSLDTSHGKIKLTTFMRDMYVTIPGYGSTKLNHSNMYGGPQLTADTIEMNFGVDIDEYVKVNYGTFVDIVNGVGGITVSEIDSVESRALADEGVYIDPGTNIHLDGGQALQYVRIRHGQSDFARTERQREAISLILQQAKKLSPKKLLELARDIAGKVECSIEKSEFIPLALKALACLSNGTEQQQIPADGTWDNGTRDSLSVLLVDFEANRNILKRFIYE